MAAHGRPGARRLELRSPPAPRFWPLVYSGRPSGSSPVSLFSLASVPLNPTPGVHSHLLPCAESKALGSAPTRVPYSVLKLQEHADRYCAHFTDEKAEAWRSYIARLRSHSEGGSGKAGLKPKLTLPLEYNAPSGGPELDSGPRRVQDPRCILLTQSSLCCDGSSHVPRALTRLRSPPTANTG